MFKNKKNTYIFNSFTFPFTFLNIEFLNAKLYTLNYLFTFSSKQINLKICQRHSFFYDLLILGYELLIVNILSQLFINYFKSTFTSTISFTFFDIVRSFPCPGIGPITGILEKPPAPLLGLSNGPHDGDASLRCIVSFLEPSTFFRN